MIRDLCLCATLVALAVALGFALAHIPNVELMTLVIFFSGYLLGPRCGGVIGFVAMSLFTSLNPLGIAFAPVALAQVIGMTCIGMVAGMLRSWAARGLDWAKLALLGLACTLFYDLITNLAMALSLGMIPRLLSVLAAGLAFSLLHMVSNLIIFAVAGPFLARNAPLLRSVNAP